MLVNNMGSQSNKVLSQNMQYSLLMLIPS